MTLNYYNHHAKNYAQETITINFQNRHKMLLKYLRPQAHILDIGCGAGRDSRAFKSHGYQVTAIDGSKELCRIASDYIGQKVVCKKFEDLKDIDTYDGVWACASLLHVPLANLPEIFQKISRAMKPGGYFYGSFKHGEFEGEKAGRHFTDLTRESLEGILEKVSGLKIVEMEITADARLERKEEWLNFILEKI